jgi:hypothetical protein
MSPEERSRRWRRQRLVLIGIFAVIATAAGTYFTASPHSPMLRMAAKMGVIAHNRGGDPSRPTPTRPVFKYSVIPGGAYTPAELIEALQKDPVVSFHYAAFNRQSIRTVTSPFTHPVYVSYRIGNVVYWTSHTLALQKDETLLTDGTLFARARCGNRISLSPQQPVAQMEPLPSTLDVREAELVLPPSTQRLLVADLAPSITWEEPPATVQPIVQPLQPNPFPFQPFTVPVSTLPLWGFTTVAVVPPSTTTIVIPPIVVTPPPGQVEAVPEPSMFLPLLLGMTAILAVLSLRALKRRSARLAATASK